MMALVVADLVAKLGLDQSALDRGLAGVTKHPGLADIGASMTRAGSAMTKSITLPVVAAAAASVTMGLKFEESMKLIQTQAGGSAGDVKYLSAEVLKLGANSQHGPEELATALYHLKSVGMDNVSAMKALTASEHLASVGGSDLETTTNAVASAYKSGIKGAQDFNQTAATINATIGAGNLRLEDYVSAMGTGVMVSAKQAGISLTDVGAAIAMMTSRGIPATRAATSLKMAFSAMEAPTSKMSSVLSDIGLKQADLANAMRTGGLPAAVELLKEHLKGLSVTAQTADLTKMFGAKSSQAILTLISNTKDYAKVQKQVTDNATSGKFEEATKAQAEDAAAKLKHFTAALKTAAVQFGNVLLPVFSGVVEHLGKLMDALGKMPDWEKKIVVGAGLIAAAIGPLLIAFGKMAQGAAAIQKLFAGGAGAGGAGAGGAGAAAGGGAAGTGTVLVRFLPAAGAATAITAIFVTGLEAGMKQAAANSTAKKSFWQDFFSTSGAILTGPGDWFSKLMGNDKPFLTKVQQDVKNAAEAIGNAMTQLGAKAATATGPAFTRIREQMTNIRALADKGFEFGDVKAEHTDSQLRSIRDRIISTLHVTQKQADAIMASMFKDWRPQPTVMGHLSPAMAAAEARIKKLRAEAARAIQFGSPKTTSLMNAIARAERAFEGMSSAARTAGNAAANALAAASGTGGSSYRGHFMAAGGVVYGRTLATIGEAGPEAVIPLTNASRGAAVMREAGLLPGGEGAASVVHEHYYIQLPGGSAIVGNAEDVGRQVAPYVGRQHDTAAAARARSR